MLALRVFGLLFLAGVSSKDLLFKRVTGVLINPIPNGLLFETEAPIVFMVDLPKALSFKESTSCVDAEINCQLMKQANDLNQGILRIEQEYVIPSTKTENNEIKGDQIQQNETIDNEDIGRRKRQAIIIPTAVGFAGGYYFANHFSGHATYETISALKSTDDILEAHIKSLEMAEKSRVNQISVINTDIKLIASQFKESLDAYRAAMNITQQEIFNLHYLQAVTLDYLRLRNIVQACKLRQIPSEVITLSHIRSSYSKLMNKTKAHNLESTISEKELIRLFSLPLTTCIFGNTKILITIKMLLRRTAKSLRLYSVDSVPMAFKNQTCGSSTSYEMVGIVEGNYFPIRQKDCFPNHPVCKVTHQYAASSASCISTILKKGSILDLKKRCPYTCEESLSGPIITHYSNEIYITNGNNISITCDNETTRFNPDPVGSTQVFLSNKCTGDVDGQPFYPYFNAGESGEETFKIWQTIPASWSHGLHSVASDSPTFHKIVELLNTNWVNDLKVFNLTASMKPFTPKPKDMTIQQLVNHATSYLLEALFIGWLLLISIILFWIMYLKCKNKHRQNPMRNGRRELVASYRAARM